MILILASVGFILSAYLLWVKRQLRNDVRYEPFCDFSDRISCSSVLKSEYADLFFLPNAMVGLFFYAFIVVTYLLGWYLFVIAFSLFATIVSFFLAGMLVRMRKLCVVCVSTYLINIALLVLAVVPLIP